MAKQRGPKSTEQAREQPPDAELEVLACLWRGGEATARQVRESLDGYRPMAHGSVMTLLNRLIARGLVTRRKGPMGKAFVFRPTRSARPTYRRVLRNMVERIFGGSGVEMVSTLLDSKPPTAEELDRLQQMLNDLRTKATKRGTKP